MSNRISTHSLLLHITELISDLTIFHVGDELVVLVPKIHSKAIVTEFPHHEKSRSPLLNFPPSFLSAPAVSPPLGARQPTILTLPIVAYCVFTAFTFNTAFYHVFYACSCGYCPQCLPTMSVVSTLPIMFSLFSMLMLHIATLPIMCSLHSLTYPLGRPLMIMRAREGEQTSLFGNHICPLPIQHHPFHPPTLGYLMNPLKNGSKMVQS